MRADTKSYGCILGAVLTEKTTRMGELGQYVFRVDKRATKTDIKRSVEKAFRVSVVKINTINVRGKVKRRGRDIGKRRDYKKAIVWLKPGDKIDIVEGL
ncbi:MAG: 50S ribosomal protein L23 [Candidatus Dadabacteria bacterium]|nr:MAG: 50S ribosomal protein L23 [Candidatus Dadabacteria bacterium]